MTSAERAKDKRLQDIYKVSLEEFNKKKEAQEKAADEALITLAKLGFVKDVPHQYRNLT